MDNNTKVKIIDKYLKKKKYKIILALLIENISHLSMYITITYQKKNETYRINYIDLNVFNGKNIEDWLCSTLMLIKYVESIIGDLSKYNAVINYKDKNDLASNVILKVDLPYNHNIYNFKRYIPSKYSFLANIFHDIFISMPEDYIILYQIMMEGLVDKTPGYVFFFNYHKNNYKSLFDKRLIPYGERLYNEDKVIKLEKIKDTYYAAVADDKNYLTTIIYNKTTKEMSIECNCGSKTFCKHLYAAFKAIENNKEIRFAKIIHKYHSPSLVESLNKSEFYLTVGIYKDSFLVVKDNNISLVPIKDKNGKLLWEIIEDDDNLTITKQLDEYLTHN